MQSQPKKKNEEENKRGRGPRGKHKKKKQKSRLLIPDIVRRGREPLITIPGKEAEQGRER